MAPSSDERRGGAGRDYLIRPATEHDWPAIWPIFEPIVRAGDTYCYAPASTFDQGRELWLLDSPGETWIAVPLPVPAAPGSADSTVLGTYHLGPNQAGPGAHIANASYMVGSAARGRGVGRALVEHSIERAAETGYRAIQFNAVVETNTYAIALYADLGFETVGRVPGGFHHPQRGFVDLLIMYRALDSGSSAAR